ncbi:MAG TPA: glycoside hydrolase family 3 N-terminal domain-containing protein, partial [Anaerolineae bacterium]|nr:glycoside hydrolase family 3 N-terminal domain-containing protein [Anaerolineae bacterium]
MKHRAFTLITLIVLASLIACQAPPQPTPHIVQIEVTATASATISATPSAPAPVDEKPPYLDPSQPVAQRVADLLARMTLEEKIGQMTQVEHNSLSPADVTSYFIGSVLSGGDSLRDNSAQAWRALITPYEQAALKTRLGIPLIYGLDAIHGNGHVSDGVLFPQNIGLGATRDAGLVQ